MKCRFLQIILLGMLPCSINAQAVQGQYKWTVKGRVVDNCGKPVPRARVSIFPPGPITGTMIDTEIADADGRFRYERESSVYGEGEMFLYVKTPFPPNAYISGNLVPPFYAIRHVDRSFTGWPIHVKTNTELNLGDVPLQVKYGVVIVYLRDRKGAPMFTSAEEWEYIGLRIRDLHGRSVDEGGVSAAFVKEAVRLKESAFALVLPEGVWQIEVAPEGLKQKWPYSLKGKLLTSEMLLVKASNSPVEVTLKPTSKRRP